MDVDGMVDPEQLTVLGITQLYKDRIAELQEEPEFQWKKDSIKYAVDEEGEPQVKVAVGNVPLDYDLWEGLRNPAVVGLYPAGLEEIWEYHANKRRERVDESGRRTIFQVPKTFEQARKRFGRAVIASSETLEVNNLRAPMAIAPTATTTIRIWIVGSVLEELIKFL
jgi:hypothetical protein